MKRPIERRVAIMPGALRRPDAAEYCGLGVTTFDRMIAEGTLPPARRYPNCERLVWLTRELDAALEDLPTEGGGPADEYAGVRF